MNDEKYCVLLAGSPASGKTTFATKLGMRLHMPLVGKDGIKEVLFDTIGFSSREEKVRLDLAARTLLLASAREQMRCERPFMLEGNFQSDMAQPLKDLLDEYGYTPLTVFFDADDAILCERFNQRDRSPQRHLGHVSNTHYPLDPGEEPVPRVFSPEEFAAMVEQRGYRRFDVGGKRIVVRTDDFAKVDPAWLELRILNILHPDIAS